MCIRFTALKARFARCKRGATAVEFAFVFPVFLFIILGLFELGLLAYTSVALESIVARSGREASIGALDPDSTDPRSEQLVTMIRERTSRLIGSENIEIITNVINAGTSGGYQATDPDFCQNPPSCTVFIDNNGNGQYDPPGTGNNFGGGEEVVEIKVRLPWRANFGFVREIFGDNGMALILASTIVKNEPFE